MARRNSSLIQNQIQLQHESVTSDKIANDAVGANQLANNSVDSDALQNSAVSTGKILDDAVTTNKILDDAVTGDKLSNDITIANDLTIGGLAKTSIVELVDSSVATFDLTEGNTARWNRDSAVVDATNTLTIDGTSGGTLDGMGFTIMAFNGDDDSDRSITFAGGTGITVHYSDSATITWGGPNKHTVISGMVFDSANVLILSAGLVGSV